MVQFIKSKLKDIIYPPISYIEPYWDSEEINIGISRVHYSETESLIVLEKAAKEILLLHGREVVAAGSGRTALELSLRVLKGKSPLRKKVILQSYGCRGTLDPILNNNLIPVYCDIDTDLVLDSDKVKLLLKNDVLAILLTNLCGYQKNFDAIKTQAHELGIYIVEDNCQNARPYFMDNKAIEPHVLIYSISLGKNLVSTACGLAATNIYIDDFLKEKKALQPSSQEFAPKRFEFYYNRYCKKKPKLVEPIAALKEPYNYTALSSLDAEISFRQLLKLKTINEINTKIANTIISEAFDPYPEIFYITKSTKHIYTKLSVCVLKKEVYDNFIMFLRKKNIEIEGMYVPLHLRKIAKVYEKGDLAFTESIFSRIINIPCRPNMTQKEIAIIIKSIKMFGKISARN